MKHDQIGAAREPRSARQARNSDRIGGQWSRL